MRVLVLCTDSFGGYGGIALYNRDLAEALALHELMDEVVMVPRIIRGDIQATPENVRFVWRAARGPAAYMKEITKLLAQRSTFDLVICAHVNLLPVARLFSNEIVLMLYGVEAWKPIHASTSYLLADVGAVISISEITLSRFRDWSGFEGPTYLLPNAIHLNWYGARNRDEAVAARYGVTGKRVLMTFGRIDLAERYKGFDEVMEVLPDLLSIDREIAYVIAGTGNDVPRLRQKAATLGISSSVVFAGMIVESEKPDFYGLGDVYVMPSRGEGFGFVLLEAMACGLPVIASRIDGGFEAVRRGLLGQAIDPSNPAEVRSAILDALERTEKRIPEGLEYFSFDNFVSRVHSIIDQLSWNDR